VETIIALAPIAAAAILKTLPVLILGFPFVLQGAILR
jgi:hypothetical protein